ncbi:MAG: rod shape-determining protein MreD [Gammaproteobacteria bacterium]
MERPHAQWVITLSFVVAFMLTALPLPSWASAWRPAWVAMVLVYWCIALPQRVGVVIAWVVGLFLDVLTGALLGQHAAGLAIVAWVAVRLHLRIRVFPLGQQALVVGLMLAVYLAVMALVGRLTSVTQSHGNPLLALPASMLLWPWLFILLRDLRRRFQVT